MGTAWISFWSNLGRLLSSMACAISALNWASSSSSSLSKTIVTLPLNGFVSFFSGFEEFLKLSALVDVAEAPGKGLFGVLLPLDELVVLAAGVLLPEGTGDCLFTVAAVVLVLSVRDPIFFRTLSIISSCCFVSSRGARMSSGMSYSFLEFFPFNTIASTGN